MRTTIIFLLAAILTSGCGTTQRFKVPWQSLQRAPDQGVQNQIFRYSLTRTATVQFTGNRMRGRQISVGSDSTTFLRWADPIRRSGAASTLGLARPKPLFEAHTVETSTIRSIVFADQRVQKGAATGALALGIAGGIAGSWLGAALANLTEYGEASADKIVEFAGVGAFLLGVPATLAGAGIGALLGRLRHRPTVRYEFMPPTR